eukprot:3201487-Ditylum_brightwellii.AAC.1
MKEPKLRYTNSLELNSAYASDNHIQILEGSGLGGFFTNVYQPRVWNGVVHYTVPVPQTPSPIENEDLSRMCDSFLTTADFFSSSPGGDFGVMFNIKTIPKVKIVGFDIVTTASATNADVNYEIFTKRNSFQQFGQTDMMAWHYVAAGVVRGHGPNRISSIPPTKFVPVSIPANTVQGFYFTLHTPELLTHGTALSVGGVFAASNEIQIHAGASVGSYPFGDSFRSRRAFSGTVQYQLADGDICGQ